MGYVSDIAVGLFVQAAALGAVASAQCLEGTLLGADLNTADTSGSSVCIDGNVAIVGAKNKDDLGTKTGAAYIFERTGGSWVQTAKIVPSDLGIGHFVGDSVCVLGEWAMAGATGDDYLGTETGSVYAYRNGPNGWFEFQKVVPTDAAGDDQFGHALAMHGNRLIVGARSTNDFATNSGSAYMFEFNGTQWVQTHKFHAGDPLSGSAFGFNVAVYEDTVLIGAQNTDEFGQNSGSIYFYDYDGTAWNQTQKLFASDPDAADQFGRLVTLWGDTAMVASQYDDDLGVDSGSVYVLERTAGVWAETHKLNASDGQADNEFGVGLDLKQDIAIIGAFQADTPIVDAGAAYVFRRVGGAWVEGEKLMIPNAQPDDLFGRWAGLSGTRVILGSPLYDGAALHAGGAFVFSIAPVPIYCTAKLASDGCLPAIGASGINSVGTAMEFNLTCVALANKPGIAFFGLNGQASIPFFGGTLCMTPPLIRGPILFSGLTPGLTCPVNATPLGTFAFEFNAWNQATGNFVLGTQLQSQFWYRDTQQTDGTGVGLSDAVEFDVCP